MIHVLLIFKTKCLIFVFKYFMPYLNAMDAGSSVITGCIDGSMLLVRSNGWVKELFFIVSNIWQGIHDVTYNRSIVTYSLLVIVVR